MAETIASKEFTFSEGVPLQKAEITFSELSPKEKDLVEAVISWNIKDDQIDLLHQVHGRSLIFQSPDRLDISPQDEFNGNYGSLQIIGAGGSRRLTDIIATGLTAGILIHRQADMIFPPDPTNHAEILWQILELRKFDEQGRFISWERPYAPLHGMDAKEAVKRKTITGLFNDLLETYSLATGKHIGFNVPKLVAEGFFPEKIDPSNQALTFQVYRVPGEQRFPDQLLHSFEKGLNHTLLLLLQFSLLAGRVLKFIHDENMAYMDCHAGNMSLLSTSHYKLLYITDLGSMHELANEVHPNKYKAFDLAMFFEGFKRSIPSFVNFLNGFSKNANGLANDLSAIMYHKILLGLTAGYFESVMLNNESNNFTEIIKTANDSEYLKKLTNALLISENQDNQVVIDNTTAIINSAFSS